MTRQAASNHSRETKPCRSKIEEPDAEVPLELADLAPEGRPAHAKRGGRPREPAGVGDRNKVPQVSRIHGN